MLNKRDPLREMRAADLETYNTQEGVRAGLRKIIVANVPTKILVEYEDAESGLDEVEPRTLLETIRRRTAPITCLDAKALKAARDALLTFNTADPLTTQFALSKKAIADLQRIHGVATSETKLMMEWFREIEKEKDFEEDHVVEFRALFWQTRRRSLSPQQDGTGARQGHRTPQRRQRRGDQQVHQ